MKMLKWCFLMVAFVSVMAFTFTSTCTADDMQSQDETVMTDNESAYDDSQYMDEEGAEEGGMYEEGTDQYDEGEESYSEEGSPEGE